METPLSADTQRCLDKLFAGRDRDAAARLLREACGNNLPFLGELDAIGLERYRFAALKLSRGSLRKLDEAVQLAKQDWRDLLLAAEFGDVDAHKHWFFTEIDGRIK